MRRAWNWLMSRLYRSLADAHRHFGNLYGNRQDQDEKSRTVASILSDAQKAKMPVITHPIARAHPVTGRKALYAVSGSSFGIVGMPDDEATALLDELAQDVLQGFALAASQRKAPGKLVEGSVLQGWKAALGELALIYPERIKTYL